MAVDSGANEGRGEGSGRMQYTNLGILHNARAHLCIKNYVTAYDHLWPWHLNFYLLKNKVTPAKGSVLSEFGKS